MKDYKRIEHMRNLNDSLIWERMKRCYDYGYEDGQKEKLANAMIHDHEVAENKAYNRGLDEAWDAARKIHDGQIPYEAFGLDKTGNGFTYASPLNWGETITAKEAIAKIKEYEDKQKQDAEINVGDEVTHNGAKFIVLNIDSQTSIYCLDTRGRTPIFADTHNLTKTGRHFDQIAEVLKEMRGTENDK